MSWSLQGLWAGPWLRDVAALDRPAVVAHLGVMAIAVAASAFLLGILADRLCRRGFRLESLLGGIFVFSIAAQAALLLDAPLPSHLLWSMIAAAGAATVVSFAIMASYQPAFFRNRKGAKACF